MLDWEVRRVLRPRSFKLKPRQSRHDRQYGPRIWRDNRFLSDRFGNIELSEAHWTRAEPHRACRDLCESSRAVPHGNNGRSDLQDRKSTRLNSSHRTISYAVFCLKK